MQPALTCFPCLVCGHAARSFAHSLAQSRPASIIGSLRSGTVVLCETATSLTGSCCGELAAVCCRATTPAIITSGLCASCSWAPPDLASWMQNSGKRPEFVGLHWAIAERSPPFQELVNAVRPPVVAGLCCRLNNCPNEDAIPPTKPPRPVARLWFCGGGLRQKKGDRLSGPLSTRASEWRCQICKATVGTFALPHACEQPGIWTPNRGYYANAVSLCR
jgi:hypothetical protein